jgi:hypothetical protein
MPLALLLPLASSTLSKKFKPVGLKWTVDSGQCFLAWRCHEIQTPSDRLGRSFFEPSCACFALAEKELGRGRLDGGG